MPGVCLLCPAVAEHTKDTRLQLSLSFAALLLLLYCFNSASTTLHRQDDIRSGLLGLYGACAPAEPSCWCDALQQAAACV
jgi:hypothetical protein